MAYVENLRTFVRAYDLGSMSAAGRDLRVSAAVASSRIAELERQLGARLFHRTTRSLQPTQQGVVFYGGATRVLDAIEEAESEIAEITSQPRGTIFVSAPLGLGKKLVAPAIASFQEQYPDINVHLRLSDRKVDVVSEGLDVALILGKPKDSDLRIRPICSFKRVLCASPSYIANHGMPKNGNDLIKKNHKCLMLRYPGATEFFWTLRENGDLQKFAVSGPLDSDDGDVLTDWALGGAGIINKPCFEIADHLNADRLVPVATDTPPSDLPFSCLFPHKRLQDSKSRVFMDHMVTACLQQIKAP